MILPKSRVEYYLKNCESMKRIIEPSENGSEIKFSGYLFPSGARLSDEGVSVLIRNLCETSLALYKLCLVELKIPRSALNKALCKDGGNYENQKNKPQVDLL